MQMSWRKNGGFHRNTILLNQWWFLTYWSIILNAFKLLEVDDTMQTLLWRDQSSHRSTFISRKKSSDEYLNPSEAAFSPLKWRSYHLSHRSILGGLVVVLLFQFRNPLVVQGSPGKNRCSDTHFLSVYCVGASALSSLTVISFYPASSPERWVSFLSSSYSWGNGVTGIIAVTRGVGIRSQRTGL